MALECYTQGNAASATHTCWTCWPDAAVSRADLSLEFFKRTKPGDDSTKDRAGIGSHPPNGISVRSYHEVEVRASLDGRGRAIEQRFAIGG